MKDCVWCEWSEWSGCSKTCGGGQTQKHRVMLEKPSNGGTCDAKDAAFVKPCNEVPCGTVLHRTVPYGTALYRTVPYSTVRYRTLPFGTVRSRKVP